MARSKPHASGRSKATSAPRTRRVPAREPEDFGEPRKSSPLKKISGRPKVSPRTGSQVKNPTNDKQGATRDAPLRDLLSEIGHHTETRVCHASGAPVAGAGRSRPGDEVTRHPFWNLTNELERPFSLPPWIVDIVAEGNEMLILAQLNFWFRRSDKNQLRARVVFDDVVWVAKTFSDLGTEIHRNERQVEKAVTALKKKDFIIFKKKQSKYYGHCVVTHFRLNWDAIAEAYKIACEKMEIHAGKGMESSYDDNIL